VSDQLVFTFGWVIGHRRRHQAHGDLKLFGFGGLTEILNTTDIGCELVEYVRYIYFRMVKDCGYLRNLE
jgi:hypothetical protein